MMRDRASQGCATALGKLGKIARLLNGASPGTKEVGLALRVLGEGLGAQGTALFRKRFEGERRFLLERVASWERKGPGRTIRGWGMDPLHPREIPRAWWCRLEKGLHILSDEHRPKVLGGFSHLLLLPLHLGENVYGFFAARDFPGSRLEESALELAFAAGSVFEIWLAWLTQRKRLDDFVEVLPNSTFVMDKDGVITAWNPATEEMTGWPARRVVGKGNYEHAIPYYGIRRPILTNLILHPQREWEATYPEFRREGDHLYTLSFCPALPGGGAYLTTKTSKIYDLNHRLWGAIHTVRDVSRERRMERSLHRSESMYRTLTDFAGMGMMLFRRGRVLYCNERMSEFMGEGLSPEDLLQRIHPEDRTAVAGRLETLFRGSQAADRFEFRAEDRAVLRYYRCFGQVIDYEDQPTVHFILDDITEQKEMAHKARLNELRMYHEDRLAALGIMAAGIAHELNQPLNTIRVVTDGFLYGREQGWSLDEEEVFEGLEMMSRQVVRMSEVIKNIRDFAREDPVQSEAEMNPNIAVENVFSMIGRQLEAHGIEVRKSLHPHLPCIRARISRVEQVIMNLIVNARQALDGSGREKKQLWVRTGKHDGHITIEVGDNGSGIPPEIGGKIFDPFFTTKEVGQGTGLGLTISQSIVSELKGRIEVFNNERGGATFVVTFPCQGGKA